MVRSVIRARRPDRLWRNTVRTTLHRPLYAKRGLTRQLVAHISHIVMQAEMLRRRVILSDGLLNRQFFSGVTILSENMLSARPGWFCTLLWDILPTHLPICRGMDACGSTRQQ